MLRAWAILAGLLLFFSSFTSFSNYTYAQESTLPEWVKNIFVWYGQGQVSESELLSSIEWLIENKILKIKQESSYQDKDYWEGIASTFMKENQELKDNITLLEKRISSLTTSVKSTSDEKTDSSQLTVEELKKQAISWNYKDILRNEEHYKGKIIFVTGEIFTIGKSEKQEGWVLLSVYTNYHEGYGMWFEDLMYIWYDGSRLLTDDIIEAYVLISGVHETETLLKGSYLYYPIGTARHVTCTNC